MRILFVLWSLLLLEACGITYIDPGCEIPEYYSGAPISGQIISALSKEPIEGVIVDVRGFLTNESPYIEYRETIFGPFQFLLAGLLSPVLSRMGDWDYDPNPLFYFEMTTTDANGRFTLPAWGPYEMPEGWWFTPGNGYKNTSDGQIDLYDWEYGTYRYQNGLYKRGYRRFHYGEEDLNSPEQFTGKYQGSECDPIRKHVLDGKVFTMQFRRKNGSPNAKRLWFYWDGLAKIIMESPRPAFWIARHQKILFTLNQRLKSTPLPPLHPLKGLGHVLCRENCPRNDPKFRALLEEQWRKMEALP